VRLKSLQLRGFKSFASPTLIEFDSAVVGIVGPNGCGKSNVLDAIRWVMGEQSMKSIRGKARADVIFNGSEHRAPEKYAQVTMTLEGIPEELRPEGYEKCDEIAITRRMTNRGKTEYFLNGDPCRLRDIRMLFLGTGLGKHSYSLIEQGRISEFIQSTPEKRRLLIEEAAGISRYKEQRKQAESKMKQTQHNLDRLGDVMRELSNQRNSLKRQATKARKHRRLTEEVRDLDLYLASHKWLNFWAKGRQIGLVLEDLHNRENEIRAAIREKEEAYVALQKKMKEESEELQGEREKLQQTVSEIALLRKTDEHYGEDLDNLGERQAQIEQELERITASLEEDRQELQSIEHLRQELDQESDDVEEGLSTKARTIEELETRIEQTELQLERFKSEMMEAATESARLSNQTEDLKRRHKELQQRREQLGKEQENSNQQEEETSQRLEDLEAQLQHCEEQQEATKAELEQLSFQQETVRSDYTRTQTALRQLQELMADRKARLESLQSIQTDYSDLNDASRILLNSRGAGQPFSNDEILGAVADFVESPELYEPYVATILGSKLQYLVVDDEYTAMEAIQYLNDEEKGRTGFITMPKGDGKRVFKDLPDHPGLLGNLAELVREGGVSNPVMEHLLGDTLVVRELSHAFEIRPHVPETTNFITSTGEVLTHDNVILGGQASSTQANVGILARRRQLKQIEEELESIAEREDDAEDELIALEERLQILMERQDMLREHSQQWILKKTGLEKDVQRYEDELTRQKERLQNLEEEENAIEQQWETLSTVLEETQTSLAHHEERRDELQDLIGTHRAQLEEDRGQFTALSQELTELKVKKAARRERHESLLQQHEQLLKKQHNLHIRSGEQRTELQRVLEQTQTKEEARKETRETIHKLETSIEVDQAELEVASAQFTELERELRKTQVSIEENRNMLEQCTSQRTTYLLEQRELEVQQRSLDHDIRMRYGFPIGEALPGNHCKPPPHPDDDKRLRRLSKQLAGLGAVNPFAEKEFEEVDERYQFLKTQITDLEKSMSTLRATIKKINQKSKQQFRETFDVIQGHFKELFPKLFGGGEGDLILTDPRDLLNTGVDVTVRPPGKRRQRIALLSGGEKAMTTMALIFSFFLYKPSPFCVLDEVDAPLDDANNMRFTNLLKELSQLSQFIVITHSKITMERADHLYGVTMQEPGCSSVVAVRVDEAIAHAA
jgi:chromosome segregation protein